MRYYKGYETDERPFLLFALVADSLEELQELELDADPLVVTEDQLMILADPGYISYEYGICHKRIFNGLIEDRPIGEITAQQTALNKAVEVQKTKTVSNVLDETTFIFDGKEFPMTPAARSIYTAVIEYAPPVRNLITTTGTYVLTDANLAAFKEAYYTAVFAANDAELGV